MVDTKCGPQSDLADLCTVASVNAGASEGRSAAWRALHAMRSHLDLQVAYLSEFVGNDSVYREVDAPGLEHLIKPGDSRSLDDVYCRHILEGRLPELIPDTAREAIAAALPITAAVPIGAHVSVPLTLPDGRTYGMFCCLGPAADPTLNDRDLRMMRAFADLAAFEIHRELETSRAVELKRSRIEAVIARRAMSIFFQPIWSLSRGSSAGFEALARFTDEPVRSPDLWFADAAEAGLGCELELLAIRAALSEAASLPEEAYVAINAAPETLASAGFADALSSLAPSRLVIEVTEHSHVKDYAALAEVLAPLRAKGLRVAVDDAGAGYSGLQHILRLAPDIIKLDRALIQGIGVDPSRRALAAALLSFSRETGSAIVAEGVETEAELAVLGALGIDLVQGFLVGRPLPVKNLLPEAADCPRKNLRGRRVP